VIVADTSALYAIQFGEPEAERFREVASERRSLAVGAPTLLEYLMVVGGRFGAEGVAQAKALLAELDVVVINWTEDEVALALDAFFRFGRGSGQGAKLNYGDCMAYAMAKSFDAPLLYKGEDFALTDIRAAA